MSAALLICRWRPSASADAAAGAVKEELGHSLAGKVVVSFQEKGSCCRITEGVQANLVWLLHISMRMLSNLESNVRLLG